MPDLRKTWNLSQKLYAHAVQIRCFLVRTSMKRYRCRIPKSRSHGQFGGKDITAIAKNANNYCSLHISPQNADNSEAKSNAGKEFL